jgi:hypothetical protein
MTYLFNRLQNKAIMFTENNLKIIQYVKCDN